MKKRKALNKKLKGTKAARRKAAPPWYSRIRATILQSAFFEADSRGSLAVMAIADKIKMPIGSVVILDSKEGAERANHVHKADSHITYIAKGWMEYFERAPITKTVVRWVFGAPDMVGRLGEPIDGQMFFTPPKVEHCMRFHGDCIAVVLANKHRDQAAYEKDITHVSSLAKEWDENHGAQRALPIPTLGERVEVTDPAIVGFDPKTQAAGEGDVYDTVEAPDPGIPPTTPASEDEAFDLAERERPR